MAQIWSYTATAIRRQFCYLLFHLHIFQLFVIWWELSDLVEIIGAFETPGFGSIKNQKNIFFLQLKTVTYVEVEDVKNTFIFFLRLLSLSLTYKTGNGLLSVMVLFIFFFCRKYGNKRVTQNNKNRHENRHFFLL